MPRKSRTKVKKIELPEVEVIAPGKIERLRNPLTVLVKLIKDERISPNRGMLGTLVYMYLSIGSKDGKPVPMTEQEKKDKELIYNLLVTQFGNPKNIQWLDREDTGPTDSLNRENASATEKLREVYDSAYNSPYVHT